MASQGPSNGGTFANATLGGTNWFDGSNAQTQNDAGATASIGAIGYGSSGPQSNYLKVTNFGFSIPSDAVVDGIEVSVRRKETTANGDGTDQAVYAVKGGADAGGTNKASGSAWPSSYGIATYGGATDRWGQTWTPADVNASNFGMEIAVNAPNFDALDYIFDIDHITITVYYTIGTQGPLSPATAANVDQDGSNAWSNPTNVFASDNSRASCGIGLLDPEGDSSDNLDVTNFSFTIPSGATIDGIVVEMERSRGAVNDSIQDLLVQIIKGGTAQGDDKASGTTWPTAGTEAYTTYGSSTDKWGLTWTHTDINASTFGVRIRCINTAYDADAATGNVDHVRITVYYTAASSVRSPGGGVAVSTGASFSF